MIKVINEGNILVRVFDSSNFHKSKNGTGYWVNSMNHTAGFESDWSAPPFFVSNEDSFVDKMNRKIYVPEVLVKKYLSKNPGYTIQADSKLRSIDYDKWINRESTRKPMYVPGVPQR